MARATKTVLLFMCATFLCTVTPCAGGCPLYLSHLIKQGRIELAQRLSRVAFESVESYSGYITVDNLYDSNLFFWFLPTKNRTAPVLLWLNGGPGVTSMTGAFLENGPLAFTGEKVERRQVSWTEHFSMLYVDNPVGTGYSFTRNTSGMATSMEEVAVNLYSFLVQFFEMFPQFSYNDFYIGGQSYACKYVSALGTYMHDRNHGPVPPEVFINMKGVYMGGGFCDPYTMLPVFPDSLFNTGFISEYERETLHENISRMLRRVLNTNYTMEEGDFDIIFGTIWDRLHCQGDLDNLLGCEVLHYTGNLDLIVSVAMTEAFLQHVQWCGQQQYRDSHRQEWFVDGKLAGWYNQIGNFTRVIVRNAGHMVPFDQPESALDMMERFIFDEDFFSR